MSYKLTTHKSITNAGASTEVYEFDLFDELQDFVLELEQSMDADEYETLMYTATIEELN